MKTTVEIEVAGGTGEVHQDLELRRAAYLFARMVGPAGLEIFGNVRLRNGDGSRLEPDWDSRPPENMREVPGYRLVGAFPPGEYRGEAKGGFRGEGRTYVRLGAKPVEVVLRAGEVTKVEVVYTQEEVDAARAK